MIHLLAKLNASLVLMLLVAVALPAFGEPFVDLPKGCYSKQVYPCTLTVESGFLSLVRENANISLSKNGVLAFLAQDQMQLLKGQAWVRSAKAVTLKLSAALRLQVDGDWMVSYSAANNQSEILNLDGEAKFISKSVFENEVIPVGYQNWYSGVSSNGQIFRGIIRPIENEAFLKLWMPISGMNLAASKHKFKLYQENWQGSVEESANFYQQIVARRIASVEADEERVEAKARRIRLEQSRFRKMLRQKLGIDANYEE